MSHEGPSWAVLALALESRSAILAELSPNTSAARFVTSAALSSAQSCASRCRGRIASDPMVLSWTVAGGVGGRATMVPLEVVGAEPTTGAGAWAQAATTATVDITRSFFKNPPPHSDLYRPMF